MSRAKQVQAINKQIGQIQENTRKKLRVLQANIARLLEQQPKAANSEQKERIKASLANLRHSVRKLRTARDSAILSLQKRKEKIYQQTAAFIEDSPTKQIKSAVVAALVEAAAGRSQAWFDAPKPAEQRAKKRAKKRRA